MYCAYITTIKEIRKHSNADRLQCATIFGSNVIVDMSYKEGMKVVYFLLMVSLVQSLRWIIILSARKMRMGIIMEDI